MSISRFVGFAITLLLSSLALAHHDPGDVTKGQVVKWPATVTDISWDGAHVMYRVDVKDEQGVVTNWQVLGASPNRLRMRGIVKEDIRKHDAIVVAGYFDRYKKSVSPVYFLLADGRKLFVGYFTNDDQFAALESKP